MSKCDGCEKLKGELAAEQGSHKETLAQLKCSADELVGAVKANDALTGKLKQRDTLAENQAKAIREHKDRNAKVVNARNEACECRDDALSAGVAKDARSAELSKEVAALNVALNDALAAVAELKGETG